MQHLLQCSTNRRASRTLFVQWPSPESLYPYYPMDSTTPNVCMVGCSGKTCLTNICISRYFDHFHYPVMRTITFLKPTPHPGIFLFLNSFNHFKRSNTIISFILFRSISSPIFDCCIMCSHFKQIQAFNTLLLLTA